MITQAQTGLVEVCSRTVPLQFALLALRKMVRTTMGIEGKPHVRIASPNHLIAVEGYVGFEKMAIELQSSLGAGRLCRRKRYWVIFSAPVTSGSLFHSSDGFGGGARCAGD